MGAYSYDFCATLASVGLSCQASHCSRSRGSQIGVPDGYVSSLIACVAHPELRKLVSMDIASRSILA